MVIIPSTQEQYEKMTTSKFKRFGIPAALVVGGVTAGSFLAPVGMAAAQEADAESDADATEESEETEVEEDGAVEEEGDGEGRRDRRQNRRSDRRGARYEAATETLGLSSEEIREGFAEGKSLADMAEEQGVEVSDLRDALLANVTERIDEAVEEGRIDEDEAAEKLAELEARVDERLTTVPELSESGKRRAGRSAGSEALQEILGLTSEEIRAELAEGKTLADIGEEQGVSAEELADALVAAMNERIDEAVEEGNIEADRADEIRSQIEENVEDRINGEFESNRRGKGHRNGGDRSVDAEEDSVENTVSA